MCNTICAFLPRWVHAWKNRWDDGPPMWTLTTSTSPELRFLNATSHQIRSFSLLTLQLQGSNPTGVDSTAVWYKLISHVTVAVCLPQWRLMCVCLNVLEFERSLSCLSLLEFRPVWTVLIVTRGCILFSADLPECTQMVPWTTEARWATH